MEKVVRKRVNLDQFLQALRGDCPLTSAGTLRGG
jgi:hypothetical protein